MKQIWISLTAIALAMSFSTGSVLAQFGRPNPFAPYGGNNPYARPPVSPYINLLRPGANPAINYYGIVRPEINAQNGLNSLQQQSMANGAAIGQNSSALQNQQEIFTGHRSSFMTQSRYFMNNMGPAGGGMRTPGMGYGGGYGGGGYGGYGRSMAGMRPGMGAGMGAAGAMSGIRR